HLSVGKTNIKAVLGGGTKTAAGAIERVMRTDKKLRFHPCNKSFCGGVGELFSKSFPTKNKSHFGLVVPKWQRERLNGRAQG
ncbi:MAG: hypothetical protein IKA05_09175, partial [Clostridia bacterium]|nr:hypothetical protein [Clostridia bacterium]